MGPRFSGPPEPVDAVACFKEDQLFPAIVLNKREITNIKAWH